MKTALWLVLVVAPFAWAHERSARGQLDAAAPKTTREVPDVGGFFERAFPGFGGRRGPGWGREPWEGRESCRYFDHGWEEHLGGHGSCSECKAKHSRCDFSCSVTQFRCTAEFVTGQGPQGLPYEGRRSSSEALARESARRECHQSNIGRHGSCRVRDCRREDQTTRSGRC
ncbi:MAG: hypothetical protein HY554_05385 [Elusimicrobia bacterium]|nr:hypothetical protein [Elusimicrobiota bacterium]